MSKQTNEEIIRETVRKQLSEDTLKNLDFIKVSNVYDNRYRVNCYTKREVAGSFVRHNNIARSFFVQLVDGEVVDHTIEAVQ